MKPAAKRAAQQFAPVQRRERPIRPGTEPFIHGLARLLATLDDADGGAALYAWTSEDVETLVLRGIIAESQGAIENALRAFVRAAALAPQHAQAHLHLGRVLGALGNEREACATLERAAALAPGSVEPPYALALVLVRVGRNAEATAALRRAIEIDPGFRNGYLSLAEVLAARGRLEQAQDVLEEARRRFPDSGEVHHKVAGLRLRQGDMGGVVAALRAQVSAEPEREAAHVHLVTFALAAHDLETAASAAEALLARHPHSWRGYYLRSILFDRTDQLDRAMADLREALRRTPAELQPMHDLATLLDADPGERGVPTGAGAASSWMTLGGNLDLTALASGRLASARRGVGELLASQPRHQLLLRRARQLMEMEAA